MLRPKDLPLQLALRSAKRLDTPGSKFGFHEQPTSALPKRIGRISDLRFCSDHFSGDHFSWRLKVVT